MEQELETEQGVSAEEAKPKRRDISYPRAGLAVLLAGVGFSVVSTADPQTVERIYCDIIYPKVHRLQGALFGRLPFSATEAGIALLILTYGWRSFRAALSLGSGKCSFGALTLAAMRRALWLTCSIYVLFLVLWGGHYARTPYAVHAGVQPYLEQADPAARADQLAILCEQLLLTCNTLQPTIDHDQLEVSGDGHFAASNALKAMADFANSTPIFRGLKPTFRIAAGTPLLSRLGISGIYSPFSGDAHVNGEQPAWAQPFTACHEMAHQLGVAREGEANFVAWQVCSQSSDPGLVYSSHMVALGMCLMALASEDAELGEAENRAYSISARMSEGVREDRELAAAWWAEKLGVLSDLSEVSNEVYLRSQGQEEGVASYDNLVDLMLAERAKLKREEAAAPAVRGRHFRPSGS